LISKLDLLERLPEQSALVAGQPGFRKLKFIEEAEAHEAAILAREPSAS
jgi:hypothetical protein